VSGHLELRGATVRFGGVTALDAVDLDVAPAETVVVLGPSGSGKSTLLRAVAGLQPLDTGSIVLDGADLASVPPHRRGVGLMFQEQALFPHLDVGGNIAFGLRMHGWAPADAQARVAELLALVGLPATADRAVTTLSGGEQQRIALARSLAPRPGVLLLDEPLGALDRPLRERLVAELRDLFDQLGQTVVAVTHDHAEAFALADRIVILDSGRVVQAGPAAEVWDQPASTTVARLLAFANVAPAHVEAGTLRTPWGDLGPAPAGAAAALVRPEAVRLGADGPLEATVERTTFAGTHTRVWLALAGGAALEAEVPSSLAPPAGTKVRARIEAAGVRALRT
jgi:thiamine transport system ATP-binding protein